jgi:hypothetical protein
MAQSDQVAPGPGPKLTCSTPRRRVAASQFRGGLPAFNQCSAFVPQPEYG